MEFLGKVAASVTAGLLTALIVALVAKVYFKDDIQRWLTTVSPTCAEPGDLTPIELSPPAASGGTAAFTSQAKEGGNEPGDAVDGYLGSWWVPVLDDPRVDPEDRDTWHVARLTDDAKARTLTLKLPQQMEVRLVCVVSGLPESAVRYRMLGSVRDIAVWGSGQAESASTLQRLGENQMSQFQEAGGASIGETRQVHLRIDSVYSGETVESFDPDDCLPERSEDQPVTDEDFGLFADDYRMDTLGDEETPQRRFEAGCLRAPVPVAGLAEVTIYVQA